MASSRSSSALFLPLKGMPWSNKPWRPDRVVHGRWPVPFRQAAVTFLALSSRDSEWRGRLPLELQCFVIEYAAAEFLRHCEVMIRFVQPFLAGDPKGARANLNAAEDEGTLRYWLTAHLVGTTYISPLIPGVWVEGTLAQLVRNASDSKINKEPGILEMVLDFTETLGTDEREEAKKVLRDNPPVTYDLEAYDCAYFESLIDDLISNPEEFERKTKALREHFDELARSGGYAHLRTVINAYDITYLNNRQRLVAATTIYLKQVVGLLLLRLSACDAQAYSQGFYDLVNVGRDLSRELEIEGWRWKVREGRVNPACWSTTVASRVLVDEYCKAKGTELSKLMREGKPRKGCCAIS